MAVIDELNNATPFFDGCTTYRLGDRVLYEGKRLVLGPTGFHEEPCGPAVGLPVKEFP